MDLFVIGTIVALFLVLLVLSLLVNRMPATKSFEETKAEKRLLADQLKQSTRRSKGGSAANAVASGAKSSKQQSQNQQKHKKTVPNKQPAETVPHVEFVLEETIPEVVTAVKKSLPANNTKPKKRAPKSPGEGILVNRNEPVLVAKPVPKAAVEQPINHFEAIQPKDDVEMLRSGKEDIHGKHKTGQNNNQKQDKKGKAKSMTPRAEQVASLVDNVEDIEQILQANKIKMASKKASTNGTSKTSGKSGKPINMHSLKQIVEETGEISVSFLIMILSKAELSRPDIQIVIDYLLNKQSDTISMISSEWSEGKQDLVQRLKKQLAEREEQLQNEQKSVGDLQAKLREVRQELNAEKSQANHAMRVQAQRLADKQRDVDQLAADLNKSMTEKANLIGQLQAKLMQEKVTANSLQEYMEQVKNLTEANGALQMEMERYKKFVADQQFQHEQSLRELDEKNKERELLMSQLNEKMYTGEHEMNCKLLELEQKVVLSQTQEEHGKVDLRNMENALVSARTELTHNHTELMQLRQKCDDLNEQLVCERQTYQQGRDDLSTQVTELNVKVTNYANVLADKQVQIDGIRDKLTTSIATEENLYKQLEEQKQKNNDLTSLAVVQRERELKERFVQLVSQSSVFKNLDVEIDIRRPPSNANTTNSNSSSSSSGATAETGSGDALNLELWIEEVVNELGRKVEEALQKQQQHSANNSTNAIINNHNNIHNTTTSNISNNSNNNNNSTSFAKSSTNGSSEKNGKEPMLLLEDADEQEQVDNNDDDADSSTAATNPLKSNGNNNGEVAPVST